MYDYYSEMFSDVLEYIDENGINVNEESREELQEKLFDELWCCDSVTGNASGSYFFNREKSRNSVLDNEDLLRNACEEFCCMEELGKRFCDSDYEWMDVTIRCYLLGEVIDHTLETLID